MPPISRNLTEIFIGFRKERKGGASSLLANGTSESVREIKRPGIRSSQEIVELANPLLRSQDNNIELASLPPPPQWVEAAHLAREDIKAIREKLKELTKAQTKRLKNVFATDAPDKDVEDLSSQVTALCRRAEQSIHQIKARSCTGSQSDFESRLNVQRGLATQLQQCTQEFRGMQKEYMQKIKDRTQRGSIFVDAGPSIGSSAGGGLGLGSSGFVSDGGFSNSQLFELEQMETNSGQRSQEINQIASSINELHTIFKELAVLVIDQGSILDRIDYNIEQVVDQSREANVQLQRAERSQKSNRAMKCIVILVIINVVLIIINIIKARH